ncbi:M13 family metallopeptidase [Agathobaculum sp.]|uniref:M13 family metallopeptidase n=1 Tax=Agathobaculum sp. TaxID=2048138 RepID=UPI002A7FEBA1|nr:M13 family metallopeptidase [Agathobaculum sp.]MDY3618539.1 M13 family metallopeptidase [Agathobaculum sp.]
MLLDAAEGYNPDLTPELVMHGDEDGDLNVDAPVTRAEALAMLNRAFGGLPAPVGDNARKAYPASNFTDIPDWAREELKPVFAAGIVAGTSGTTASLSDTVTAGQLQKFIQRVYALLGSNFKDDFYATVNKTWLDSSVLKSGTPISGTLYDLMFDTEPLTKLIKQAIQAPKNEDEKRISALYHNIMDWDARNAAGLAPIQPYLDAVQNAKTLDDLMAIKHKMADELASNILIGFGLTTDAKDSTQYTLAFSTFSPSLTKEIYAEDGGAKKDAYLTYVQTVLQIAGQDEASARADANRFWEMEKALSPNRLDQQEYGDIDKIYNVYTMEQLKALFPHVDLDAVFADSGLAFSDKIIVADTKLLEATASYFDDAHVEDLKLLMRVSLLISFGNYLSRDFWDASDAYQTAFLGTEGSLSDEETATQLIQALLSDELGHLYVKAYFSEKAKADVEDMVHDFIKIYKERIQKLDWMSDATKKKAIEKLDTMGVKVGYPDDGKWNDLLRGVTLKTKAEGGSYFDNMITIAKANKQLLIDWQGKPVDKGLWPMSAYTVNACYMATNNEIVFPAGILQPPMYDVNASREENLGGIGYVIAHEITHAFDNNGAKFDKNGNATDWWTAEDYAAFQKLCDQAVSFYDGVESAPGIPCNGTLTLSENIADLGAAACILEATKMESNPDLETLFRTMARTWASTMPRETAVYYAQIDVHAPDKLRGSRVLQSLDDFYEVFDIQPGDGMYLPPEDRLSIW